MRPRRLYVPPARPVCTCPSAAGAITFSAKNRHGQYPGLLSHAHAQQHRGRPHARSRRKQWPASSSATRLGGHQHDHHGQDHRAQRGPLQSFYAPWRYVALQTVHNGSPASNPTTHGAAQRKTIDSWPILARGSHSPVEWPGPQQSQYLHAYRHSRPLTWHAGVNWRL